MIGNADIEYYEKLMWLWDNFNAEIGHSQQFTPLQLTYALDRLCSMIRYWYIEDWSVDIHTPDNIPF